MEKKRIVFRLFLTAVLTLVTSTVEAYRITGKVTDAITGETMIGATVKYSGGGVLTDVDGRFSVDVPSLPVKLSVSFAGYVDKSITVYEEDYEVVVQLAQRNNLLGDVVVVGYGTQSRTQLTGSVVSVKSEVFENNVSPTLDVALAGQVAGLNVTAASGQPGAESSIRIRGGNSVNASNEPLYVVDGFIYFNDVNSSSTGLGALESHLNPLATINPGDIESVEVLKDISATAIYGSRGANGVILITTKKGKIGENTSHLTYGYSVGVSSVSKKLNLLNASEWAAYQKTYFGNKGGYTDEQIAALGEGTDWQDAVLRNALQQKHELSLTGSTANSRYAFSVNYTDQDGIILNSGFQRYNFHANTEWNVRPGLKLGVNATYGRSKQKGLTTTQEKVFNSSPYSAGITNSFVYALLMPPVVSVYNEDGSYNFSNPYEYAYFAIGDHASNPVYDLEESVAENINNYLLSNVWMSYKTGAFTFKAAVGLNSEKLTQNYFSGAYTSLGLATEGIGGVSNRLADVWQQEYTVTYDKDINSDSHVDVLAGFTRQNSKTTYSSISSNHFTNEALKQYNLGDGANVYTPETSISESDLNSFIARANYTLLGRYNATATFRADNSSRFSKNHRWGYFPSLGLSWNAERESFLSGVRGLDFLKVRLTGGLVGNQEISDYAFSTSYSTGSYAGSSSYSKSSTANDDLKWETTASYDLGVDLGLWGGKLDIVLDGYYKRTSDLLLDVPAGFSLGVTSQWRNVGNVVNKGVELAVDYNIIKRRKVSWSVSANLAHNANEITDMGTSSDIIQGSDNQQILRAGESLGSFYGLVFNGIVQSDEDVSLLPKVNGQTPKAGDIKYVDTNNDNKIDGNDRQVLGSIQPDLTYGFSTRAQYREFDISVVFAGSVGNELYNALGRRLEQTGDSYNVLTTVKDSWTTDNASNTLPLASNSRPFSYIDSRYVQSASYLKLRNVTLGYTPKLSKSVGVGVRLYATASNLFTITSYKGFDPEVSGGTDSGAYPSARTFTLGVTLTL